MRIQSTNRQNFKGTFQVKVKGNGSDIIEMLKGHNPTGFLIGHNKGTTDISASYSQSADTAVFSALSKLKTAFGYVTAHDLRDEQIDGIHIAVINRKELFQPRVIMEG